MLGACRGRVARRDRLAAVFTEREDALFLAVVLPLAAGRARVRLAAEETSRGYALERDGEVIGHLTWFDPVAAEGFAAVDALVAGVGALAQLLEAAGGETVELAGRLLLRDR